MSSDAKITERLESLSDDDLHKFEQEMIQRFRWSHLYISRTHRSMDSPPTWRNGVIKATLVAVSRDFNVRAFVCSYFKLPTPDDLQLKVSFKSLEIAKNAQRSARISNVLAVMAIIVSIIIAFVTCNEKASSSTLKNPPAKPEFSGK